MYKRQGLAGAAPVQNIGAYGVELADVLEAVQIVDAQNRLLWLSNEKCGFGYRSSRFQGRTEEVITALRLRLSKLPKPCLTYPELADRFTNFSGLTAQRIADAVIAIRTAKLPDPTVNPNVGSFFKNPIISRGRLNSILSKIKDEKDLPHTHIGNDRVKISAAWLIDKCGLKGLKIGGVEVHKKQPLVLINRSKINDQDVFSNLTRAVMEIKQKVQTKYGISLEIEPRIYGDFNID